MREKCLCAAPAHVHSAREAFCCWSTACSPHPARSADWPHGPCLTPAPCFPESREGQLPSLDSGPKPGKSRQNHAEFYVYEDRGALRGTPGSAYPQPEPNATELPSIAPCRPDLVELQASAPSPTPTRAEEHIATTLDCRPRALARRRAPKRTSHYTCWCERGTNSCT